MSDLKNTSDDALPNYLNSLKFKQSHFLTDVRLALGYGAFAIAAACFGWDYKFGFENTKYYTAAAVAIYTLLNGFLTFWTSTVEKGTVYQGTAPSGERVSCPRRCLHFFGGYLLTSVGYNPHKHKEKRPDVLRNCHLRTKNRRAKDARNLKVLRVMVRRDRSLRP